MNGYLQGSTIKAPDDYWLRNISLFQKADQFIAVPPADYTDILFVADLRYLSTDSGDIRYKGYYGGNSKLESVEIKLPAGSSMGMSRAIYHVSYGIDAQKRPVTRTITSGKKKTLLYTDELVYDQRNRLEGFTRYNAAHQKIMQVDYGFYTMNDLPPAEN